MTALLILVLRILIHGALILTLTGLAQRHAIHEMLTKHVLVESQCDVLVTCDPHRVLDQLP